MEKRRKQGRKNNKAAQKKFNPLRTFFKIVCSIVFAFTILVGGGSFAYYKVTGEMPFVQAGDILSINASDASFLDALLQRNIKMNVAVFGVDKDGMRTDVLLVVHFDSATERLSVISVPRDTRVSVADAVVQNYKETGRSYNAVTKVNAIHAYSSSNNANSNVVLQLEDLLGIKIDHYVKVDLDAFKAIVDAIDGVDMYVPQDMYWDMRDTQDPLINLKEGYQHLDGDKAEQLVRFRRYSAGDETRVEVQQLFMKALMDKVLSTETILSNLPSLLSVMYNYVETDVALSDALKYINYIDKLNMEMVTMETIPGSGRYVGDVSYFIYDTAATEEMVDRVFRGIGMQSAVTEKDSKAFTIEVCNGSNVSGLAQTYGQTLEAAGYTITSPTNFRGAVTDYTRIQVSTAGMGADLVSYFNDARVELAPSVLRDGVDIRIVLGTGEK